jgi:hypothetical protein
MHFVLARTIRPTYAGNHLLPEIAASVAAGLLLAVACVKLSPLLVLCGMAAVLFSVVMLKRPEFGLLGILVATSSIIFENQLPQLSAGGISLHIPDLLLLGLLGLIVIRLLVEPEFRPIRTRLDWPIVIFFGITLVATLIGVAHSSVGAMEARRMIRCMAYYLAFFVVTNLVRERRQLTFLLNGISALAAIVAAAMVAQFVLGDSVRLISGYVNSLTTPNSMYGDITRIVPPGWSIIVVSCVSAIAILAMAEFRARDWLSLCQCGLMGAAILVTFLRSYWAALIAVLLLLLVIVRGQSRQRLIALSALVIVVASLVLLLASSDPDSRAAKLVSASVARISTLGQSGTYQGRDSSVSWRLVENRYAFASIAAHPLIGLGMGARYRPFDRRLDASNSAYDFRKHIHDGHLWLILDTGLLGYLAFLWLSLAFLVRGFAHWKGVVDRRLRGVVLGFTLVYLAVFIAAVVNSTFVQWSWTPVIGIIMGINEVILKDAAGQNT